MTKERASTGSDRVNVRRVRGPSALISTAIAVGTGTAGAAAPGAAARAGAVKPSHREAQRDADFLNRANHIANADLRKAPLRAIAALG